MAESLSIPGYNILRELGRGGMASVYLANQQSFDREVALKVMSPAFNSDPSFATRFIREARIVAHIHHASIVPVFDVGHTDPYHYMSMEFLPAGDLKERILGGAYGPKLAYGVCLTIASALDLAHRKGFVHRDIKPENILFREDGTAVLTDFGIARAIDTGTSLTVAGTFVGTPSYMSPEQVKGQELDGRSDLYSLGVVFYEMLTGDVPFHADSGFSIAMKQLSDPLPKLPSALAPYQAFLDKMTAKEPSARFATGAEVIQALLQIGELNVSREEIVRSKPEPTNEETLLRPLTPSPVAAAEMPPQENSPRALGWRSPQSLWLMSGLAAIAVIAWFSVSRQSGPTVVQATPIEATPIEATPIEPAPAPAPAPAVEQVAEAAPEPAITAPPEPSEAQRRAAEAAAAQRAAELRARQDAERQQIEERVSELLRAAKTQIAMGAVFQPAGVNAIESYGSVLKLQPGQLDALAGLQYVAELLVAEAVQAKAVGDRESLKRYIDLVQGIEPRHSLLAHLNRELKRLEEKPLVLHKDTQENLQKTAKLVARANAEINRKPPAFGHAESASEYYDEAAQLAPFTPGLPLLKERIIGAYSAVVQKELESNEPKRALRMVNYARERKWFSADLERLEAIVKQRLDPNSAQNAGGPRRP